MGTVAGGPQIVLHHFVDSIHSPLQRVEQTAAADHGTQILRPELMLALQQNLKLVRPLFSWK